MTKRCFLLLISILTVSIVQASMRPSSLSSYSNACIQLRGTFELSQKTKTATIKLAINGSYRLFVNNQLLAINTCSNSYQTNSYELKSVLVKGQNVIAIEVVNAPLNNFSFFFESKAESIKLLNNPKLWKILSVNAINKTENVLTFNANAISSDWTSAKFNDSNWQQFDYKNINNKVEESILPNFSIKNISIGKIAEVSDNQNNTIKSKKIIKGKVKANSTVKILINSEKSIAGFPELKLKGGKNASFQFYYLQSSCFEPYHLSNSLTDLISDKYISNGSEYQCFIPFQRRCFKQLILEITTQTEAVNIESLTFIPYSYPIDELAYVKTDNELFNKAWQKWIQLQYLFTTNSFLTNPYFNTSSDLKNIINQSVNLLSLTGDPRLLQYNIQQIETTIQSKNNVDYNDLQFVSLINQYYHYQSDTVFVRRFLPTVIKIIDFHKTQIDTSLHLYKTVFLPFVLKDKEIQQSLLFSLILDETIKLLDQYHYNSKVAEYKSISINIKRAIMQHYSLNNSVFYYDGLSKRTASQYTASLAILTGLVRSDLRDIAAQQLLSDSTLIAANETERIILYEAIHNLKDKSFVFNNINEQKEALLKANCLKTPTDISFYFGTNVIENIVGFQALSDGFNQFVIEPNISTFNKLNVRVLCSSGAIYVDLKKNVRKNKLKGKINLPKGTKGLFIWNGKKYQLVEADNEIECKLTE